ncbi:ABC transporter ATP-binding protein [Alkalihalobacillus hemicellulosilyticus]|uniref:ABC transporter protein n=1 Tax=Halalkalibacter hemicellulosilyticusJCM 9152 TaxID=1236971 RepID=W4QL15_9BACI|nr:ABC transporter ATP-binding protein [Halalkalibacter hemicellulosilyticus]GAE32333.1 ABC transporter protein [Halalkalibacter hemicellulosilyticusJCM 9152]
MGEKKNQSFNYEPLFNGDQVKQGRALQTFLQLYKGQVSNIVLSFIFFLMKHSPVWVIPVVTANMINIASAPDERNVAELWINFAVVVLVIVQNIPSQVLHVSYLSKASRHVEAGLRSTLIRKLQHLSISYHSELRSGKLQAKVLRDVENIEVLSKQVMFTFSAAVTNVVVAITVTAFRDGTMALFFILVIPLAIGLVILFKKRLRQRNREFRTQIEVMSGQVAETVNMIPVTRAHGLEDLEIKKTDSTLKDLKGKGYKLDIAEAFFGASGWVVFQVFQMICLIFTAYLVYRGQMPIGDIALYQAYFTTILMSVNQIINVYPQLAKGYESIISVSEVLFSKEMVEYQGEKRLGHLKGQFTFDDVSFHYKDTKKHVLNRFNLTVKPGECIAFVGESGAGKSTVLSMVVGFYRPTEGKILIDGVPFDDLNMQAYRQRIAVVPQNTVLFSGSIRDNITYGLDHVSEGQLQQVVQMANLHDVIAEMPDGLNTLIGEHGGKLSGGQRQRIAIARALVRNPEVILLDEATSALDNKSEFHVQEAIRELIKGRTTFIVAHRLSTIRDADRIVVMKEGRCVEVGTYDELMEKQGEFYQLKKMQH